MRTHARTGLEFVFMGCKSNHNDYTTPTFAATTKGEGYLNNVVGVNGTRAVQQLESYATLGPRGTYLKVHATSIGQKIDNLIR